MNTVVELLQRRRLVLAVALLLAFAGIAAWQTMDRQEDPFFPYRKALVLVSYPGADARQVEQRVLDHLEEEIAQIEDVKEIEGEAVAGLARITLTLHESIYDTQTAWDRVRIAVKDAQRQFPAGVADPIVDDRLVDTISIVLSVSGSGDVLKLRQAARELRRRLFAVGDISRIEFVGDPGEQVSVLYDDARAVQLNLPAHELAQQLASRNQLGAGGQIQIGQTTGALRPATEFRSIEEISSTPVILPSGGVVGLSEIADIRHETEQPLRQTTWHDGERAVALAIVIPREKANAVELGHEIRAVVETLRPEFAPLVIEEMFFQPDHVESRLSELGNSLLFGIAVVAGILFLVMGLRLGLVVAVTIPLVTFSSVALYAAGGGILHQIAIAGMVVALGMLVDNAIVMAENIQWHLDQGKHPNDAANLSVHELFAPLGVATGTTLAAFVPMLISTGNTADFTRMIPTMIMLILLVSYLFAIFVTPTIGRLFLRARATSKADSNDTLQRLGAIPVNHPWKVVIAALFALGVSVFMTQWVDRTFFPNTARQQLVVDIEYPTGTHLSTTTEAALTLSRHLRTQVGVEKVFTFTGNSGPSFYYNLTENSRSPNIGRIVVLTDSVDHMTDLFDFVERYGRTELPDAQLVPRRLGQGPPTRAPIEIRVNGGDLEQLEPAANAVLDIVRSVAGTRDARSTLGRGTATLRFNINDATASRFGLNREAVAQALYGRTLGQNVGDYRAGDDPIPIRLRSPQGESMPAEGLETVALFSPTHGPIPLLTLVNIETEWRPASLRHYQLQRSVSILSQLDEGVSFGKVQSQLDQRIAALELPPGISIDYGGQAKGSGEANVALLRALPLGLLLLLFFLLLQFNSFRRVGIILSTVPLALIGVIPGLVLSGSPFGFTSMLGVIALIGIVVNNAIVLVDVLDRELANGTSLNDAIRLAVERRTRPIMLTTATTVAGLFPLTLTESTLWPPLAWTIISGLLASTFLTLMVVPALCRLLLPIRANEQCLLEGVDLSDNVERKPS